MEGLAALDAALPGRLLAFGARLSGIGATLEMATRSMVIRWTSPGGRRVNLGAIRHDGALVTDWVNSSLAPAGLVGLGKDYQRRLAAIIGGGVRETTDERLWYVVLSGKVQPPASLFLDHADAWIGAMRHLTDAVEAAEAAAD